MPLGNGLFLPNLIVRRYFEMKKSLILVLIAALLLSFCACAANNQASTVPASTGAKDPKPETEAAPQQTTEAGAETEALAPEGVELNIYSLKGPTSMGLVTLLEDSKNGKSFNTYHPTMCTAADEVTAALMNGSADIALLPANAAATLFNKAGGFSVVGINTLGVLYVLEKGETVQSLEDLAGKTIFLTGKGTVPEFSLRYVLAAAGIEDQVTLEFKSEPQEVVEAMNADLAAIGLLPQPFVTAALAQNEGLRIALSLTEEWGKLTQDSLFITGVTVVRNEILEQYPEQIKAFLKEAAAGVETVNAHPEEAAPLIEALGIVAKAPLAQKAIPFCNLVCITGQEMKTQLSGYLKTLFDQNPKAVGGAMPADEFYYTGE